MFYQTAPGDAGEVSVQYVITDHSTATSEQDYIDGTETLIWRDGDSEAKHLNITLIDDSFPEATETIQLMLVSPTGHAVLGEYDQMTISIHDNDPGKKLSYLQFSAPEYPAREEDGSLTTLKVTRTGEYKGEVSVQYVITDQSTATSEQDYIDGTRTLTWRDGDSEAKYLNLTLIDDRLEEATETIQFTLISPTGKATLGTMNQATLTIFDNDGGGPTQSQLQFIAPTYLLNEGIGTVEAFTVTRHGDPQGKVSVYYTVTGEGTATIGLDYLGGSGVLTWADGDNFFAGRGLQPRP